MKNLANITLCCVDTRNHTLAEAAIDRCTAEINFGEVLFFTNLAYAHEPQKAGVKAIALPDIKTSAEYSHFILKELINYIKTPHVLIVQWDGFIINASNWDDRFLLYDYIGAVWPQFGDSRNVGNGGFSLRSKRLMERLLEPDIETHHPEDVCICRTNRSILENKYSIKFAPEEIADNFSAERKRITEKTFGIHGLANLGIALTEPELAKLVQKCPPDVFLSTEARGFVKNICKRGLVDLADAVLKHRIGTQGWTASNIRIWLRLKLCKLQTGTKRKIKCTGSRNS